MSGFFTITSSLSGCQWIPNKNLVWALQITSGGKYVVIRIGESFKATVESDEADSLVRFEVTNKNDVDQISSSALISGHPVDRSHLMDPRWCRNLCWLNNLHEAPLLLILKQRFLISQHIYTYTGGVLISINPYFDIPNLYVCDNTDDYQFDVDDELPPHVFKIASNALVSMKSGSNQSVIISGESGAGKTEASKHVIRFLLQANSNNNNNNNNANNTNKDTDNNHSLAISSVLVQGGSIFEAFGNAKTVRNDNSSRFGKYIKLLYGGDQGGTICSAVTETFLLEKSRLMSVGEGERNYHIFYQLVRGLPLTDPTLVKTLHLHTGDSDLSGFHMLSMGRCTVVDSEQADADEFLNTVQALKSIGIKAVDLDQLWTLLACLLHLGNVTVSDEGGDPNDPAEVTCPSMPTEELAELMGISIERLLTALTTQQLVTGKRASIKIKVLSVDEVKNNISALIKWIYNKLFSWLVSSINHSSILPPVSDNNHDFIGILDIFGFEILLVNSFEQLCINFTNERLQQQFNEHVFSSEQQMYRDEGLSEWTEIQFQDNQPVIDLICKKSTGLLNILEEQGMLNRKPDDLALVTSFNQTHSSTSSTSSAYVKSRFGGDCSFSIRHFAGEVKYLADGFLLKNNDSLQDDLVQLLAISTNSFLTKVVDISAVMKSSNEANNNSNSNKKMAAAASVSSKFRDQLDVLISTLRQTEPHYIKCIKPNPSKAANVFHNDLVMQQLRYSGVLEVIRIRREGFPIRMGFLEFYEKYFILTRGQPFPKPKDIQSDLEAKQFAAYIGQTFLTTKNFQLGHSHVFLRDDSFEELKIAIGRFIQRQITLIQRFYRKIYYSNKYLKIKRSAIKLHALSRQFVMRRRYLVSLRAARIIKWFICGKRLRGLFVKQYKEIVLNNLRNKSIKTICTFVWTRLIGSKTRFIYLLMKYSIIIIQKYYRRRFAQKLYLKQKRGVLKIQSIMRMRNSRRRCQYLLRMHRIVRSCVRNWITRYYRNFVVNKKVTKIQVLFRKFVAKRRYTTFKKALIAIQSAVRGKVDRKKVNIMIAAIIALQSIGRMIKIKRKYRRILKCVISIQSFFRCHLEKKRYKEKIKKIIIIQSIVKMSLSKFSFLKIKTNVKKLQRFIRMVACKKKYNSEVVRITKCQALIRAYLKKKSYLKLKRILTIFQSLFRMRLERENFLKFRKKIIKLQSFGRMIMNQRRFMEVIISVVMLQAIIRMKIHRLRYKTTRNKVIKIQSIVRMRICYLHRQTQLFSIILLQSVARMIKDRRDYTTFLICVILVQSWWRKTRSVNSYSNYRNKVIKVQSLVRMKIQSIKLRFNIKSIIRIQSFGRMVNQRRLFGLMMISVITLQTTGRCFIIKRKYKNTRNKIIKLQSWNRMLIDRTYYKYKILKSVATISKYYRMFRQLKRYAVMIRHIKRLQVCGKRYIRNNKLRYIILSLHDNLASSSNLFEEYKSELNKVKMLLGLKMVRNKWRDYCTIFHSAILGNNLKHLAALAGMELNLGVSLTKALSLNPTVKDVMELDILGRNSLFYLCMCPTMDSLRTLRGSLNSFTYRESRVVVGGFEADDDEGEKDRTHTDSERRISNLQMHNFKNAVEVSVKNHTLKSGWLKKKRTGMVWQKRWVVLTDDYLVYYSSPQTMQNPRFAVSLKDATLNRPPGRDPVVEISSVHMPEKKSMFGGNVKKTIGFLAENEIELQEWLMPLKSVVGIGTTFRINSNKPVHYINNEIRKLWTSISDKKQQTPLHYLAMNIYQGSVVSVDEVEVACWLIENGCSLNAQDVDGNTPLHLAIHNGSSKNLVRCFIVKGSDVTIKNNSNRTAISLLDQNKVNHDEVLKVLSSIPKLPTSVHIEKNRLALDHRSLGYSYLSIFFTKQDVANLKFSRPMISVHLFNLKKNLMEECLNFAEASKLESNSLYWGSVWNMLIPIENLENGSFFIIDIQDEASTGNNNVLWGVYNINLNDIDSSGERTALNIVSVPNRNQKIQTLLHSLSLPNNSSPSNMFLYFDVLIHKRNKDVGSLQDILG